MSDLDRGEHAAPTPALLSYGRHAPDDPGPLGPSPHLDTVESETRHHRRDGWTPVARAGFLETLARSGVVTDACKAVDLSSQAAYNLRNRDRLFAAGWDAAVSMARPRLADELFHRAVNGTVDQIWKDGEVVGERHRHDNRLSMAVLNRLDARTDRAENFGAPSLRLAGDWGSYLTALAEDRTADIEAMLAPLPGESGEGDDDHAILGCGDDAKLIHQLHQLRQGKALDQDGEFAVGEGDADRVWTHDSSWRTNFPPPDDFRGDQHGGYGDADYHRQCTPEEWEVLDRCFPDIFIDQRSDARDADEAKRDAFFAALAEPEEPAEPSPPLGDSEEP